MPEEAYATYTYDEAGQLISKLEDSILSTYTFDKQGKGVSASKDSKAPGGEVPTTKNEENDEEEGVS